MRLLALVVAAGACASAQAQSIDCDGGKAQVRKIVEMPGKDAAEVYRLAQRWVALAFHNKDKVVQTEVENELIRGDGYESQRVKMAGASYDLKYSFAIDVKDQKLRFTMYNMLTGYGGGNTEFPVESYLCKPDGSFRNIPFQTKGVKESIETFSGQLIASLNNALAEKKEDW